MARARVPIIVPDLARSADTPITMSHWARAIGQRVQEGARLTEVTVDKADVELVAPVTGVLVETTAAFGDEVTAGQVIGWLDPVVEPWVFEPPPGHPGAVGRCRYCTALLFAGDVRCTNCAGLV